MRPLAPWAVATIVVGLLLMVIAVAIAHSICTVVQAGGAAGGAIGRKAREISAHVVYVVSEGADLMRLG